MHTYSYRLCIMKKPPSDVERRPIYCAWRSTSEENTIVGCWVRDVTAMCRRAYIATRYGEGDVAIIDVGKEAAVAVGYRRRDATTMFRRGEVTARCREGGVVFADVGKVVITTARCRGRAAAAVCRRGDVAAR